MTTAFAAIDGFNLLRRVYEPNPDPDSSEKAKKACESALSTFRRALTGTDSFKPTHALAAFDAGGITWRHELYAPYKAERKSIPYLREALPGFIDKLKSDLGLKSIVKEGVEAEDVIATLLCRWTKNNTEMPGRFVIYSNDKDLHQLFPEKAEFRDVFKREWVFSTAVVSKFGVEPEMLGDLLALSGDATDGVPGVPLIGVKTAAKYLLQYKDLEGVLTAAVNGEIKGKAGEALVEHADTARLSRALVTLRTDLTLGLTWKELALPT